MLSLPDGRWREAFARVLRVNVTVYDPIGCHSDSARADHCDGDPDELVQCRIPANCLGSGPGGEYHARVSKWQREDAFVELDGIEE